MHKMSKWSKKFRHCLGQAAGATLEFRSLKCRKSKCRKNITLHILTPPDRLPQGLGAPRRGW
jgi:hypothetical protein